MDLQALGKYRIDRVIGRGAMGIIYEAFDTTLQRHVAIKTMTSELTHDPELRSRFYREARAAANLRHPNIITIFDMGEHEESPYIVMELLHGTDLKALIAGDQRWPLPRILDTAIQIARGLHYAHQKGVVHRDIKPANIFLCEDGLVKILDFGVAFVISSTLTQAGKLLGSLAYMAPEQVMGQKVDARADLYSLGVILYELVTGTKPFMENDLTRTIQAILRNPPVPPVQIRQDCPPALAEVIIHCLQKEKEKRVPNLPELIRDLKGIQSELSAAPAPTPAAGDSMFEPPPPPTDGLAQTRPMLTLEEILSRSRTLLENGDLAGAYGLVKQYSRLYQGDPEFETFYRQLRKEKESFDKKGLFQKHYHDALRLLAEDNFSLARFELDFMLRIDGGSPLISQLEQQISRREEQWHFHEWLAEGRRLIAAGEWAALEPFLENGRERFGTREDFEAGHAQLMEEWEKAETERVLATLSPLEEADQWDEAVDILRPMLRRFPQNRELVEKYNDLMRLKLEWDRQASLRQFADEQLRIVDTLLRSHQVEPAQKYLLVLLEKFPGHTLFEEKMMEIENHLEFQRSIAEIRELIETEDHSRAQEQFQLLEAAYPGNEQLEIMAHELDHLKMILDTRNLQASKEARLHNALRLSEKGAFDKALAIVDQLMGEDPGHTGFYTTFLSIRREQETREREMLLQGLAEIDQLESAGELFRALEKARGLMDHFPDEAPLAKVHTALKERYVTHQVERIRQAIQAGTLDEATALLESNVKLLPDETAFTELQDNIDMETEKATFIKGEIDKAKEAVRENRVDEALEIVNNLIPLNPDDQNLARFLRDLINRKTRSL